MGAICPSAPLSVTPLAIIGYIVFAYSMGFQPFFKLASLTNGAHWCLALFWLSIDQKK